MENKVMDSKNKTLRQSAIAHAKQIIVKAGTRLVIDRESIGKLIDGIAKLRAAGHRVVLVTSRRGLLQQMNDAFE